MTCSVCGVVGGGKGKNGKMKVCPHCQLACYCGVGCAVKHMTDCEAKEDLGGSSSPSTSDGAMDSYHTSPGGSGSLSDDGEGSQNEKGALIAADQRGLPRVSESGESNASLPTLDSSSNGQRRPPPRRPPRAAPASSGDAASSPAKPETKAEKKAALKKQKADAKEAKAAALEREKEAKAEAKAKAAREKEEAKAAKKKKPPKDKAGRGGGGGWGSRKSRDSRASFDDDDADGDADGGSPDRRRPPGAPEADYDVAESPLMAAHGRKGSDASMSGETSSRPTSRMRGGLLFRRSRSSANSGDFGG
eukprot:CAMPEP_0172636976 /NCGR_PEP_ID=MMETSP1068-20121228/206594_1 /TAXON_ID=35684 /ORGANISM="Pseudopedinella elastica, Strain CCMP716" /LENGTH=304 /DNA_ID=CAMNT_0013449521 /DNA_START=186 /DNA_END=1096 /DNA_ORIENTATION=-